MTAKTYDELSPQERASDRAAYGRVQDIFYNKGLRAYAEARDALDARIGQERLCEAAEQYKGGPFARPIKKGSTTR